MTREKIVLNGFALTLSLFLWAGGMAASGGPPIAVPGPASDKLKQEPPSPSRTETPVSGASMVAPSSAPSAADAPGHPYLPAKEPKGSSRWHSSMALGGVFPLSGELQGNYPLGFNGSLGSGYQVSKYFSGWIVVDFDHFTPRGTQSTQYNIVGLALWAKLNFTDSDLSPYVFLGPGASYNEIRSNTAQGYDYYTGEIYFPVNAYEFDFMTEGGLGLDVKLSDGFRLFLQGKMTVDFLSRNFAGNVLGDSPSILIPVQLGVDLGL